MTSATVTLFRPTGPSELALIEASGFRSFPPRLPHQPIFYPVVNLEYATQIARDWNVKSSGAGFVLQFEVDKTFLDSFEVHQVGSRVHVEYWIPAERLDDFNQHIVGPITLVAEFR